MAAVSIGTRPDCLGPDVLDLLERLNRQKPVWVELGLQTIHEETARYIRRGYPLSCFEESVRNLRERDLEVIVHTILGLPGESRQDILATMDYLNHQDIQGIKLQLLHVAEGHGSGCGLSGRKVFCIYYGGISGSSHRLSGTSFSGYRDPPAYGRRAQRSADRPFMEQQKTYSFKYPAS